MPTLENYFPKRAFSEIVEMSTDLLGSVIYVVPSDGFGIVLFCEKKKVAPF